MIRVELVGGRNEVFWPRPGRTLIASTTHSFGDLAHAIDRAFARWDLAHLWAFALDTGERISEPDPWEVGEADHDPSRRLSTLRHDEQFLYEFDFGDSWIHLCTVEEASIDPTERFASPPNAPVPIWGWGDMPDQHGRRWFGDDGDEDSQPPGPTEADFPDVAGLHHLRRHAPIPFRGRTEDPSPDPAPTRAGIDSAAPNPGQRRHLQVVPPFEAGPAVGFAPSLPVSEAIDAFLGEQSRTLTMRTVERHSYALGWFGHDDQTIGDLASIIDAFYDTLRANGITAMSIAELNQTGVAIRKIAAWAASHELISAEDRSRIVERTKSTGGELAAAQRFGDALRNGALLGYVTRTLDGATAPVDEAIDKAAWVIDSVDGESLKLSATNGEGAAIHVSGYKNAAKLARPGWVVHAAAERRGTVWVLLDVGHISIRRC